jgi:hypothetical protein
MKESNENLKSKEILDPKSTMGDLPGQLGNHGKDSVISDQPRTSDHSKLPVGIDELNRTDRIIVQQTAGVTDNCKCYEGENTYTVSDRFDHVILEATEASNCCSRKCCQKLRSFDLVLNDRKGQNVITIERPYRCDNCFCCPGLNQVYQFNAHFFC